MLPEVLNPWEKESEVVPFDMVPPTAPPKYLGIVGLLSKTSIPERAISAILANIDVETDGTFDYQKNQDKGPAYGLFQFDVEQQNAYFKDIGKKGILDSDEAQVNFMADAIYNKDSAWDLGWEAREALQESFDTGSTADITKVFSEKYEKPKTPHMQKRLDSAVEIEKLKGLFSNKYLTTP
tara:strand:- start:5 stop:547 length:543 start_codon:yes stop_codon:yes gene_type:complete